AGSQVGAVRLPPHDADRAGRPGERAQPRGGHLPVRPASGLSPPSRRLMRGMARRRQREGARGEARGHRTLRCARPGGTLGAMGAMGIVRRSRARTRSWRLVPLLVAVLVASCVPDGSPPPGLDPGPHGGSLWLTAVVVTCAGLLLD